MDSFPILIDRRSRNQVIVLVPATEVLSLLTQLLALTMQTRKHLNVVGNGREPVSKVHIEYGFEIELAILALVIHAETLLNLLVSLDNTVVEIDACLFCYKMQPTSTRGTESPISSYTTSRSGRSTTQRFAKLLDLAPFLSNNPLLITTS